MNKQKFNIFSFFRKLNPFNKKYTITMLNSQWRVIKNNLKLDFIPRKDEYIWDNKNYYIVDNVVHSTESKHISIIVTRINNSEIPESQLFKK